MSTYRREHYLAKLRPFYNDSGLIKVITGIRRCGKSSLLITVLNELFEQGIPETNLIYLNLDRRRIPQRNHSGPTRSTHRTSHVECLRCRTALSVHR